MGLRHKELQNMIIPLISIDEFEPKSGTEDEVIVIAFFLKEEIPAYDLDDFIDKSVIEILDSEVSPNPNDENYYLVFVEVERKPNFITKLFELIKDVEKVTGKLEWEVQPYLSSKVFSLYDKELPNNITLTQESEDAEVKEEDYFRESALLKFKLDNKNKQVTFEGADGKLSLTYVGFGNINQLITRHHLREAGINLNTDSNVTALRLLLGSGWDVTKIEDFIFLQKEGHTKSFVVKG